MAAIYRVELHPEHDFVRMGRGTVRPVSRVQPGLEGRPWLGVRFQLLVGLRDYVLQSRDTAGK